MARILLADDDASMLDMISRALAADGHTMLTAADGQEALDLAMAADSAIDLLVTDVQMPGLDGVTLAEKMMAQAPGLRVILMSGFQGDMARADRVKLDGARFLAKPFTLEQLRLEVRQATA